MDFGSRRDRPLFEMEYIGMHYKLAMTMAYWMPAAQYLELQVWWGGFGKGGGVASTFGWQCTLGRLFLIR